MICWSKSARVNRLKDPSEALSVHWSIFVLCCFHDILNTNIKGISLTFKLCFIWKVLLCVVRTLVRKGNNLRL